MKLYLNQMNVSLNTEIFINLGSSQFNTVDLKRLLKHHWVVVFSALAICCLNPSCNTHQKTPPNIVLIMADDIGISDLSCYGGEIATPHLDRLAREGLRFSTFYNMAKCNPTRSTMLTGLYQGGNGAVHLAHLTKQAGYYNVMSGKEHFDRWVPDYCVAEEVFDHSFYFWATTEYFLPPSDSFQRPFYLEGKKIEPDQIKHRQKPMYKTDFITDYALDWLDEGKEEQSFFLYLPYHSAHYPLQARPEDIAKYRGKYLNGWDEVRQKRYERMRTLGVLPPQTKLSPPEGNLNTLRGPLIPAYTDYFAWESLSEQQQDTLDLEMAVYAAMIDRMDQNIGRVLSWLESNDEMGNTVIMFLVDNGACPFYSNKSNVLPGSDSSYWCQRSVWANVANTPYRQYKQTGYGGGSHTPFIAYWPGVIESNTITHQVGHVVDLAPTFLDILNINYPDSIHGLTTLPLDGTSLLPIFQGKERAEPPFFMSGLNKHRMYRKGQYKINRMNGGEWALFDVEQDPAEMMDLATDLPDVVEELAKEHDVRFGKGNDVYKEPLNR